jgi:hypothetical protein
VIHENGINFEIQITTLGVVSVMSSEYITAYGQISSA